jgi:hypothetical protein
MLLNAKGAIDVDKDTIQSIKPNYGRKITPRIRQYLDAQIEAELSNVAGVPNGTFKSLGGADQVELNAKDGTHSLYLPIKGFSAAQIGAMSCQTNRIFINLWWWTQGVCCPRI